MGVTVTIPVYKKGTRSTTPQKGKGSPSKVGGWGMGTASDPDQAPRWLSQLNVPEFVCKITPGGKLLPGASLTSCRTPSEPLLKSRPTGLTLSRPQGPAVQSPLVPTWGVPTAEIPKGVMALGTGEEVAGPTGNIAHSV